MCQGAYLFKFTLSSHPYAIALHTLFDLALLRTGGQMAPIESKTVADSIEADLPRDRVRAVRALRSTNGTSVQVGTPCSTPSRLLCVPPSRREFITIPTLSASGYRRRDPSRHSCARP